MALQFRNSSFKIKTGSVPTTSGLVPEQGAIVFDESLSIPVVGDGFNWLPIVGQVPPKSSIATNLLTPIPVVYTAGVPVTPVPFYDNIVYQNGTNITVAGGNTVNINANLTGDYSSIFVIQSDQNQTVYTLETLLNGNVIVTREIQMAFNSLSYSVLNFGALSFTAGDVLTFQGTASKNCTITLLSDDSGMKEV